MVSLGPLCLPVLVLRKPCQVCGPIVLDAILRVRESLYLLVVHDRREVVEDAVVVLKVRDRREVGHGLAVVALVAGEHESPRLLLSRGPFCRSLSCYHDRNCRNLPLFLREQKPIRVGLKGPPYKRGEPEWRRDTRRLTCPSGWSVLRLGSARS